MLLKKINTYLARISSIGLLLHMVYASMQMFGISTNKLVHILLARGLFTVTSVHIILSAIIVFVVQKGPIIKGLLKESRTTIIQRITGLLILIIGLWHISSMYFIHSNEIVSIGEIIFTLALNIIFFALCSFHLSISFSKSLITTGLIYDDKGEKIVNKITYIVSSICFILSVISICFYFINL